MMEADSTRSAIYTISLRPENRSLEVVAYHPVVTTVFIDRVFGNLAGSLYDEQAAESFH